MTLLQFNLQDITLDDLVEFEEGDQNSVRFIRGFLGRFVANGDGVYPPDEGTRMVGKLKIVEIQLLIEQFQKDVDALTNSAVNPTTKPASIPQ